MGGTRETCCLETQFGLRKCSLAVWSVGPAVTQTRLLKCHVLNGTRLHATDRKAATFASVALCDTACCVCSLRFGKLPVHWGQSWDARPESPAVQSQCGSRHRTSLPDVLLSAGGSGNPEGPAAEQIPRGNPALVPPRRPGAHLERRTDHHTSISQWVSGKPIRRDIRENVII